MTMTSEAPETQPSSIPAGGAAAFRRAPLDRRTMFRRAGMVALIGGSASALAACSGSSSNSAGPATSAAAPASSAASPSASAPASAATSASSSASSSAGASETPTKAASSTGPTADAAHTVAKTDVAVGGGKIGSDFVVTQPTAGEYKAFTNVCTHQGCMVTKIDNGTIDCPCHRSMFSIKDGSVVSGPAPKPLPGKTVTASGSNLLIS